MHCLKSFLKIQYASLKLASNHLKREHLENLYISTAASAHLVLF